MSVKGRVWMPASRIPQANRPIDAAGCHELPVTRECHAPHQAGVSLQTHDQLLAVHLPDTNGCILTTARGEPPVARERHSVNRAGVAPVSGSPLVPSRFPTVGVLHPHRGLPRGARLPILQHRTPHQRPLALRRDSVQSPPPHNRTVPSAPPLTRCPPSPESATRPTTPECPFSVAMGSSLPTVHTRTVPSTPPLANVCPSPDSATPHTPPV